MRWASEVIASALGGDEAALDDVGHRDAEDVGDARNGEKMVLRKSAGVPAEPLTALDGSSTIA